MDSKEECNIKNAWLYRIPSKGGAFCPKQSK